MKLPITKFFDKKSKEEFYLSLVLKNEKISAVIFKKNEDKADIIGAREEELSTVLEDAPFEEILTKSDKAISAAEESLPENIETQKTIFGVKDNWITDGKIKKEHLLTLKRLSEELDLKPVGFLVVSEAVLHLLQKEEGAPVSAILVDVGNKNITVSLVRAGRVAATKVSSIQENLPITVDMLLRSLTDVEVLPSRIILIDSKSETTTQEFVSHAWDKGLPFLHLPQIKTLPSDFATRAVLLGAVGQMGLTIDENSYVSSFGKNTIEEIKPEENIETLVEKPKEIVSDNISSEYFGFMEESDVTKAPVPDLEVPDNETVDIEKKIEEIPEEERVSEEQKKQLFPAQILFAIVKIKQTLLKGPNLFKSIPSVPVKSRKLLLLPLPLILLVAVILYLYFFGRSATIVLNVSQQSASRDQEVVFSENESSENTIPSEFVTAEVEGKQTTKASGKKEVGEKAKGIVTIFNNNDSSRSIPVGTVLKSSNDLEFVTDRPVTVASASGSVFDGTKPGTADVAVTASKFGTEYNLPSNAKFSLGGSSSLAAKNDKAFEGGTKKEVTVIAAADLTRAEKELLTTLREKANGELESKLSSGSVLLPVFTSEKFTRKVPSADAGDEAKDFSLTGVVAFEGISYKKSDLVKYAKNNFEDSLGDKLTLTDDIEVEVKNIEEEGEEITATLSINAKILPKIDERDLKSKVSGKSYDSARKTLSTTPNLENVDISVSPNIPLFPKTLPMKSEKIKIVINTNG